jgi:Flp pilus assembly pilin Flp
MRPRVRRQGERGATAVEYALMVSLVVGVIIVLLVTVGHQIFDLYNRPIF